MKNTNKTTTTTVKTWHRTLALLLLILIAFSSASCNTVSLPDGTEAHTNAQSEKATQKQTEAQSEKETQKQTDNIEQLAQIVPFNWEVEERISQEYWEKYCAEGREEYRDYKGPEIEFYGQFEDAYILYVEDNHNYDNIGAYFIEEYEFRFQGSKKLYAYRGGEFLSLEEALENEIIDVEDLGRIHEEFKTKNSDLYKKIYVRPAYEFEVVLGELQITIQPAYNGKEYTVEDFSEIGCIAIDEYKSSNQAPNLIYRYMNLHLDANNEEELMRALRKLENREDIYSASLRGYFWTDDLLNDAGNEGGSSNVSWAINKISLPDAWEIETGSNTVKVGIIDRGIDASHPDLQNIIDTESSKCFDPECLCNGLTDSSGHGTQVAGIIGAQGNNAIGVRGVCWNIELVSLKVAHTSEENINADYLAEAIEYAEDENIKILNMSISGADDENLKSAINNYSGLIICSAGNTVDGGKNIDDAAYRVYPVGYSHDNIIGVGASTEADEIKYNSNYGAIYVDVFAPGENILTTYPIAKCQNGTCGYDHTAEGAFAEGYHYFQNTSAATPFVTGVAALMMAQDPYYTPILIKDRINDSVDKISSLSDKCVSGGRLNAYRALHRPHSYNHLYLQHNSSKHKVYCACGVYVLESHLYIYRYSSVNLSIHNAYCKCGAYITQSHSMGNPNSAGVATCRKCGYGVQMWGDKPKPELELT